MPFPVSDLSLGSRFWQVSDLGDVMGKAVRDGIADGNAVKNVKHDAAVFSFAADDSSESVRSAINRAEIFAAQHTLSQEARAQVIEAEAQVPLAMAEAFRNGNLGIMDYYWMKNIQADTEMRETIAKD